MANRGGSDPGKKPARRTATGITKVGSGFGRPKGDKPRSPTSPAVPKNLFETKGETRKAAPVRNRNVTIKAGAAKAMTKVRAKQTNAADVVGKTKTRKTVRLEEALAHHNRPITTAEARRMNEIIRADRPVPELRPRRR
ncbi:hypothetical protein OH738_40940 (plasmid) [Streptomyces hirsutus]|uniref:hypothetical protein n=1 Tax=Streptomyces hirsutus TaxID=35620 RepID=UPI002F908734|nr:hypothetical protein OH738_40940 [Streptomyces hirsutus]